MKIIYSNPHSCVNFRLPDSHVCAPACARVSAPETGVERDKNIGSWPNLLYIGGAQPFSLIRPVYADTISVTLLYRVIVWLSEGITIPFSIYFRFDYSSCIHPHLSTPDAIHTCPKVYPRRRTPSNNFEISDFIL